MMLKYYKLLTLLFPLTLTALSVNAAVNASVDDTERHTNQSKTHNVNLDDELNSIGAGECKYIKKSTRKNKGQEAAFKYSATESSEGALIIKGFTNLGSNGSHRWMHFDFEGQATKQNIYVNDHPNIEAQLNYPYALDKSCRDGWGIVTKQMISICQL
ncbi:hypothetical protein [uncultured Shewanella sp.]|uniref:hypothetical protein n=1 Tax=uncultured Shewanella sp. TaxID=173975 RepID=UPI00260195AB|nr:hypothetical protein [uncultured Shewanella sp.]